MAGDCSNRCGQDGYHQTLPRKYVRFNADAPAKRASFLTLCQWPIGRYLNEVEALSVAVEPTGQGQWRIGEKRTGEPPTLAVSIGGASAGDTPRIQSDARLAAVAPEELPFVRISYRDHVAFVGGSYLRVDGQEVLRADHPVSAAIERAYRHCPLRAHFWADTPTRITMRIGVESRRPVFAFLNDKRIDVLRDGDLIALTVPAGESRLTIAETTTPAGEPRKWYTDLLAVPAPSAPAFESGVRTRASSSWSDGIDAVDGDVNTAWVSMPGVPMPQWLEVRLPKVEPVSRMDLNTGLPCAGRLEAWDRNANDWRSLGRFDTTADHPSVTVAFDGVETDRLRAVVERIDTVNRSATIYSWRWRGPLEK